jgi:hypothetical protein
MKKPLLFIVVGYSPEEIFLPSDISTLNCLGASKMKCFSAEVALVKKWKTADQERRGV